VKRLQDHVKAVIAPYKYPRAVKFVDALPRTQTGKIQRFKCDGKVNREQKRRISPRRSAFAEAS
jgi:acyl-coenzyme A synthetase/AMP-(fatty) acid ligase